MSLAPLRVDHDVNLHRAITAAGRQVFYGDRDDVDAVSLFVNVAHRLLVEVLAAGVPPPSTSSPHLAHGLTVTSTFLWDARRAVDAIASVAAPPSRARGGPR